ncbi:hypothetical protein BOX15_Mlig027790g5, partial [Macrostomum lignano]
NMKSADESLRSSCRSSHPVSKTGIARPTTDSGRVQRSGGTKKPGCCSEEDADPDLDEHGSNEGIACSHLIYLGKCELRDHPSRMRYLKYSSQRLLMLGRRGLQEMMPSTGPDYYLLQRNVRRAKASDCTQTKDKQIYTIVRFHAMAILASYNEQMMRDSIISVPYPLGCLASIAADDSSYYIYGTNLELNCVLRFPTSDLGLTSAERFGSLWRPFDCCVSQTFPIELGGTESSVSSSNAETADGDVVNSFETNLIDRSMDTTGSDTTVQYLFVSNLDAGICVFNLNSMKIVAHCGEDLLPGAKYLAYDSKRSILFVSASSESILRCYKFEPHQLNRMSTQSQGVTLTASGTTTLTGLSSPGLVAAAMLGAVEKANIEPPMPRLTKLADFLVGNRQPTLRASGPQCIMWDPDMEHLVVLCHSHIKGKFKNKIFRVTL